MKTIKNISLFCGIVFSIFFVSFMVLAWSAPGSAPTGGNVAIPINESSIAQIKTGPLEVQGLFIAQSNVGIGVTNPQSKLHVAGDMIVDGNATVGTGIITNTSGGIRPACNASTRGLMWYEYSSSGQDDILYICQKLSNGTYAYTAVTTDWPCGDNFIDSRDSNIYPTVKIGTQCWMAKNLAYLPSTAGSAARSTTTPLYYVYDYNGIDISAAKATSNYTTYGVLYNWPAATTACPTGWHLPTDAEFTILTITTGNSKEALISAGWFNNLFAGYCGINNDLFDGIGLDTYFWSSSASDSYSVWSRNLSKSSSTMNQSSGSKIPGFSVRCLRD